MSLEPVAFHARIRRFRREIEARREQNQPLHTYVNTNGASTIVRIQFPRLKVIAIFSNSSSNISLSFTVVTSIGIHCEHSVAYLPIAHPVSSYSFTLGCFAFMRVAVPKAKFSVDLKETRGAFHP